MSEIKNGGLDQYGAERFGRLIFAIITKYAGIKGLKYMKSSAKCNAFHTCGPATSDDLSLSLV